MTASTEVKRTLADTEQNSSAPSNGTVVGPNKTELIPDDAMIIVPVRNVVLFPGMTLPLALGRPRSIMAAEEAARTKRPLGVILQSDANVDEPTPEQLYRIGTVATRVRHTTASDGSHQILCEGQHRFQVIEYLPGYPYLLARIVLLEDADVTSEEIEARSLQLKRRVSEALSLLPQDAPELANAMQSITSGSVVADVVTNFMDLPTQEKQAILETLDVQRRLDRTLEKLGERIEVLKISRDIAQQTKKNMRGDHRESILREQLKAIQKELGESEDDSAEVQGVENAISKAKMPVDVETQARKELKRLGRMPEATPEYGMIRTYLDWLCELPWSVSSENAIDLRKARAILDEDHFGLEKIKRRILEHLAVRKLNPTGKSPILCLVGPPGVGKTSLGQSIARSMGREFVRLSLGGIHDEAEIRGHRRTYIGALPGKVIQSMRYAGTCNPVFMLDEIDKLSTSFQGDPSSALLEVLDPEQNSSFRDNYLAVPFDLSQVLFICTANVIEAIPGPLRDRMEVIELPSYTAEEKVQIAKRHLVSRQLQVNGLSRDQCDISEGTLRSIVEAYTRDAGVRNLDRQIGSVCRHVAMQVAEGTAKFARIEPDDLNHILGPNKVDRETAMRTTVPGVATGLAWTPDGGDILFVEATRLPGHGKLILTGHLGNVMKESGQTALSLLKSRAAELGIDANLFAVSDIHVHVPAGAIPKDGPSAGVTLFTALVTLLRDQKVRNDTAMTGEVSLHGLILPVGGIKEKVLAAHRAGIKRVLLPTRNQKDVDDIPETVRREIEIVWVEHVDDVIGAVLSDGNPQRNNHETEGSAAKYAWSVSV